jgi:peroxiredoxin
VELQEQLDTLQQRGIGVAAISYDTVDVVSDFSERRGITFPLLADPESRVIKSFGILNTVAEEGVGDKANDPGVQADVAKYVSAFGANSLIVGTPYPGTFILNRDGIVTSRFFEEFYRERNTTSNIMLKTGVGVSPIAAVRGETAHLSFTAYPSNTSVTVGTRFSLALDVAPGAGMHVYAPGAEEKGYRVIGFELDPTELARIEPVNYPESEIYFFEPLDEHVPIYQSPFTILQEVVMNGDEQAENTMSTLDALTLTGTLNYQACDDAICFLPQSIPMSFTVDLETPDRKRANR